VMPQGYGHRGGRQRAAPVVTEVLNVIPLCLWL
jgi:hypothetical protein